MLGTKRSDQLLITYNELKNKGKQHSLAHTHIWLMAVTLQVDTHIIESQFKFSLIKIFTNFWFIFCGHSQIPTQVM